MLLVMSGAAAASAAVYFLAPPILRAVAALVVVGSPAIMVVMVAAAAVGITSFVLLRAAPALGARRHGGGDRDCDRAAGFKTSRCGRANYSSRHRPGWSQRNHELEVRSPVAGNPPRTGQVQVRVRNSPGHRMQPRTGRVHIHVHVSACSRWRGKITYVLPYLRCCGRKVCTHLAREAACQQEGGCNHCTASTMPTACCTSRRSRWGEGRQAQSYQSIARISKAATVA